MTEDERVVVLRRAYELFNDRRVDELLALMAVDVQWPDVANSSVLRNKDALRSYWQAQFEVAHPVVEPERFMSAGQDVVAVVNQRVTDHAGAVIVPAHVVYHRYTFDAEGLVRGMTVSTSEPGDARSL